MKVKIPVNEFSFIYSLCKVGNENIIYVGIVRDYYLSEDGDLDAITLQYAMRRKMNDDSKENSYYEIPSDILYLPYKDIININIRYISLDKEQNNSKEQSDSPVV